VIEEGALADILLVYVSPLEDLELVSNREENLALIVKDGALPPASQPAKEVHVKAHRFKVAFIAAMTVTASLLLTAPIAIADKGVYKLDGAWVAKVVGFPGQWSYMFAPDPSGRRAYGHGSIDVGFDPAVFGCALGDANAESPILINIRMTGPDTLVGYSVWYALRKADPAPVEIVYIGEVRTESRFIAPGKTESTHYFAFYLPTQDVDPADGFPDEGQVLACSAPVPVYTGGHAPAAAFPAEVSGQSPVRNVGPR